MLALVALGAGAPESNREAADRKSPQRDLFSAGSAWEIAIKAGLGKLELPESAAEYVSTRVSGQGMIPLPINQRHALHLERMPLHHRDPFDRILIAQAQIEGLAVLTADPQFRSYDVKIFWAGRGRLRRRASRRP